MNRLRDWWLECQILLVRRLIVQARTQTAQRLRVAALYDLIDQRSPEQRSRMEKFRGLM